MRGPSELYEDRRGELLEGLAELSFLEQVLASRGVSPKEAHETALSVAATLESLPVRARALLEAVRSLVKPEGARAALGTLLEGAASRVTERLARGAFVVERVDVRTRLRVELAARETAQELASTLAVTEGFVSAALQRSTPLELSVLLGGRRPASRPAGSFIEAALRLGEAPPIPADPKATETLVDLVATRVLRARGAVPLEVTLGPGPRMRAAVLVRERRDAAGKKMVSLRDLSAALTPAEGADAGAADALLDELIAALADLVGAEVAHAEGTRLLL
jgi:hypothetical protein